MITTYLDRPSTTHNSVLGMPRIPILLTMGRIEGKLHRECKQRENPHEPLKVGLGDVTLHAEGRDIETPAGRAGD